MGLPRPPRDFLRIQHEAIPGFKNENGVVTGMEEMEMHFPDLGPDVHTEGFSVGDAVEADMEVRWKTMPRARIVSLRHLPTGATLQLAEPDDGRR